MHSDYFSSQDLDRFAWVDTWYNDVREKSKKDIDQVRLPQWKERFFHLESLLLQFLQTHAFQRYGLRMERDGSIRVEELLDCPAFSRWNFKFAELELFVRYDERQCLQRFKRSGNWYVRALHGHYTNVLRLLDTNLLENENITLTRIIKPFRREVPVEEFGSQKRRKVWTLYGTYCEVPPETCDTPETARFQGRQLYDGFFVSENPRQCIADEEAPVLSARLALRPERHACLSRCVGDLTYVSVRHESVRLMKFYLLLQCVSDRITEFGPSHSHVELYRELLTAFDSLPSTWGVKVPVSHTISLVRTYLLAHDL
jgi:hypothetical protein